MLIKYLKYRIKLIRIQANQNNIFIDRLASFSKKTKFGGYNKIFAGADVSNSSVGKGTYVASGSVVRDCKIGAFCSIGPNVTIIRGQHPSTKFVSTHPAFFSLLKEKQAGFNFVDQQYFSDFKYSDENESVVIDIGNDVWIGTKVMIMEGVSIGDGVIVAAGCLVTKNLEPYGIYGGIPARLIKKRFTDEQIAALLRIRWWEKKIEWIKLNVLKFHDIEQFITEIGQND